MSLLQNSNAISEGGYNIANSLRFQAASASYLSRTFGSAASGTTATFSFWMKRGSSAASQDIFGWSNGVNTSFTIEFQTNDQLSLYSYSGGMVGLLTTSQVFRDFSSWYHVVCVLDTTNATSTDRLRMYINGTRVTSFGTSIYPAQNTVLNLATTGHAWGIGIQAGTGAYSYDGYLSEFNFIDGQALTPSSFGETDTLTGQWVAKKYTGTYGTNGFYLPFSNGTSTTTLGYDSSGNSNNWTLNNFTRSAGTTDCWVNDVPSGNGSQAGGTQPNSNYPVFNPIDGQSIGLQLSNLYSTPSQSRYTKSTLAIPSSGKWYAEFTINSTAQNLIGISAMLASNANNLGYDSKQICYQWNGAIQREGSNVGTGASITTNDVLALAVNADTQEISFYKNGTVTGVTVSYSSFGTEMFFAFGTYFAGAAAHANFGQRSFAYTPPSGFKALCTANLPASTIVKGNQFMDATLYTGNGSTQTITNAGGFSPDFVWLKNRSIAQIHGLFDSVRGAGNLLSSDQTAAETSASAGVSSFNSNGFGLGNAFNNNTNAFVAWQWDAGSSTVTNTDGTISSQVRANPTAGVSIVTWTGSGAVATVGHGLGIAPKMMIVKSRGNVDAWRIYHESLGNTKFINFDTAAAGTASTVWNNTTPSSSVFTLGTESSVNGSGRLQVAYCFAEIAGFSKFGSYTGNGSTDGTFVYTGFRPKFLMWKKTNGASSWVTIDSSRDSFNVSQNYLLPNLSNAEATTPLVDFTSNGFKLRTNSAGNNGSGDIIIYMAFASNPFQNSNAF